MRERIDRTSPVPLYHQIAQAIRNGIAVGDLSPGARLPPVREAAREWGVNLHTVRRAYQELGRDGLLRIGGSGTAVRSAPARTAQSSLAAFMDAWLREAQTRFGLTPVRLGQLLLRHAAANAPPVVYVVECSREQAEGHAAELMQAWHVDAKALVLAEAAEPPAGVLIGTYFHYNDIRQRWPDRLDEVRFVAITPDPALTGRLPPPGRAERPRRLLLCDVDESKALNIAADLRPILPHGYAIEPRVMTSPTRLPRARRGEVLLVSPRLWGALSDRQRDAVIPIRYCVRQHELEEIGLSLGWQRASARASA